MRFAMAEYPSLSLLILGMCSLQNYCDVIWAPGGFSANLSSKKAFPVTRLFCDILDKCLMPAPCLAFTVPGRVLNAFLCNSFSHDGGGWVWGICETLLCCSWTCSRMVCCLSSRVGNHVISSDYVLISSACWRCRCDRTDTWVRCAISSSMMSASSASLPWRAWASAHSWVIGAFLCARSCCNPWAHTTLYPIPFFHVTEGKCLYGTSLFGTGLHLFWVHAVWEYIGH